MKIFFPFNFSQTPSYFMRRAGYAEFNDPNNGQTSYVRRLQRDFYPRFHVYVETDRDNRKFANLHLDQKKPSYAGAHAHNAEYDGGQVEIEGNRLAGLLKNQMDNQKQEAPPAEEGKGFWGKLFG